MSRRVGNSVGNGVSELESRLLKTGAERLALLEAEEICGGLLRRCGLRLPPGAGRPDTEMAFTGPHGIAQW